MCGIKLLFLSAIGVLFTLGLDQVTAIEVSTPSEVTAVNGTDVKLKCSFKSTQPVSENLVAVNWMFRPLGQTSSQPKEISVFYYQQKSYPPTDGMFKDHVTWSGNVMKNDASITLLDVQFTFNGTYRCQVQNPPDVHGYTGEISLQVVQSVKLSELGILAAAVGGAILLVLVILAIFLCVRYCRAKHEDMGIELDKNNWKQPGVL